MTSSPGSVTASTACTNAMFAPAVTITRLPRATSMPFSRASLRSSRATSAGSPSPGWYSCVAGSPSACRAASMASRGGP